ncbi:MAG: hypothetical protein A2172_02730 [Candidatus Woykebacteria bacterium RBG_13_40_15]|uniref:Uncharacterized protein n=1 Tax=Candidatus Woykebacteria bacterium RBG_13_40_15 TaxID=1802593 RepID=A0A1G1WA16_9BACT|nr:MAG: hypothetical protein A2172_02730 [Candidatus Woykebacteria bacterium RBG_13_40_15]
MKKLSLIKTIDELALPVILIVAARYLGIFISAFLTPVKYSFSTNYDLLSAPFVKFVENTDLFAANSFSWLITSLLVAFISGFVAFRNLYLHEDWLHPKQARHIYKQRLDHFIINANEAFHQGISWFIIAVLILALSIAEFISGALSTLAFGFTISVSTVLIFLFWRSLQREIRLDRKEK